MSVGNPEEGFWVQLGWWRNVLSPDPQLFPCLLQAVLSALVSVVEVTKSGTGVHSN